VIEEAIPAAAAEVLDEGTLCYLAAASPRGPHVTPVVFVHHGGRVWATTARGSVKARLWKRDPRAAGLVVAGDRAVTFRGSVRRHDALDPGTWASSLARAPALARASTRFTLKNLRYFAGYARDARRVPFGWTPPGRVVVSLGLEEGVVLGGGAVTERWGPLGGALEGRISFRAARGPALGGDGLPAEVRALLDEPGSAALGVAPAGGLDVVPARWAPAPEEGVVYAVVSREVLASAGPVIAGGAVPAALVVDRASRWRAADMTGLMLRGRGEVFDLEKVASGARSLEARAGQAGPLPSDAVVVRLKPERMVWWLGWSSGTVFRP